MDVAASISLVLAQIQINCWLYFDFDYIVHVTQVTINYNKREN